MTDPDERRLPPDEPDDYGVVDERGPRSTGRSAVALGARILTGIVGLAVAIVVVGAASVLPLPSVTTSPPLRTVTPAASAEVRVCAGPLLALGDQSGRDASTATSFGRPRLTRGTGTGFGASTDQRLEHTDDRAGAAPDALTSGANGSDTSDSGANGDIAGAQSQVAAHGDEVGLAAAECREPTADSWLVGGATDTGRTTLVTLSNPTRVASTVDIAVSDERGSVAAAGARGIIVPPSTERVVSLAAFAPDITSPVVHVQSRGGQIVAGLQQSTVRTLEPGGVDTVGSTAPPSTRLVVPGLVIANSAGTVARQPEPGFADLRTTARLFVPGTAAAKIRITIVADGGKQVGVPATISIPAGKVTEVPLDNLADGSYTVTITSNHPVVGGVRASTAGATGQTDFAWLAAAPALDATARFAVPTGPAPALHLANPGAAARTVTLAPAGGTARTVTVPAHGGVAVPVAAGSSDTLTGARGLFAAISYAGDGQLAGFTLSPPLPASTPVRVYP